MAKWSRYLSEEGGNDAGHIMQTYSYDTTSQSELCNRAISKLKKICDVLVTYEVELVYLPKGIKIGDTVNVIDNDGKLYLSARIMSLVTSESNDEYTATLGNYSNIGNVKKYVPEDTEGNDLSQEKTPQDDTDAMLVDHEYRITLLELGV